MNRGTSQSERIDAWMIAEPLVFIREEQFAKTRINVTLVDRQPPSSLARRISAQEPPLAIEDDVRIVEILAERHRSERMHPDRAGEHCRGGATAGNCQNWSPAFHLGVISIVPVAVRPNRSGRYMSSTFACGNTYRPGENARTT